MGQLRFDQVRHIGFLLRFLRDNACFHFSSQNMNSKHYEGLIKFNSSTERHSEGGTKSRQKPLNGNKIGEMGKKGNAIGGDAQAP